MDREEAIKNIKEHCYFANLIPIAKEALAMAIKALEQQPCTQEKQANADKIDAVYIDGFKAGYSQARFDLEQKPCEDAISRAEVLDLIDSKDPNYEVRHFKEDVECIPPMNLVKNSEWIDFLSDQFNISRTSAKDMLHGMMSVKREDNFKKQFSGRK